MPQTKSMSPELAAMLARPRNDPIRETTPTGYTLEAIASMRLRQVRFYKRKDRRQYPVDADCISSSGHLKPIAGRP